MKNKKTHTFFLKIEVEMMSNNGDFCEEHGGFKRGSTGEDNKQSQKFEEKPKCFKNWPICAKHAIFTTELSRKQVARTLKTKILKNFLSVFRDWKFYPRGSHEVNCENL